MSTDGARAFDETPYATPQLLEDSDVTSRTLLRDFLGEIALGVTVCAIAVAIVGGFQARPGLTLGIVSAACFLGWAIAWRESKSVVGVVLLMAGFLAVVGVLYLSSCSCR